MIQKRHGQLAAVQMNSGDSLDENLATARALVLDAARAGADLVVLPEYFYLMGKTDEERVPLAEAWGSGRVQRFLSGLAKEAGVWLLGGTAPIASPDSSRIYNSSLMYNPAGESVGRYDKVHLFGFQDVKDAYAEADTMAPGTTIQTVDTPFGPLRCSVCYDLRFPELYRTAPAPTIITVPAAFTYVTGEAHWEVLLRARAIENQCYVIAAAQTGMHPNDRRTYGHSMIINPWGEVLSVLKEGTGFTMAPFDADLLDDFRRKLPALQNRVF
ncbi:carbon-nitrogen hydrolase family protein [Leeia oryzae]|uniref:carbon-nitrogen hydrolase family protein n=1 Tax=Leeia oryzae TaxID=356662 RepID=UPI0003655FD5|nr:carbon-nitrogen hydrolase family protein [Leeia oryzae]